MFERDVFYECSHHSGEEPANFEGILTTLPSSALQPAPLSSIMKTIKSNNKKNTTKCVSVGVSVYYDYFSQHNNQDVIEFMTETSLHYRHSYAMCEHEMDKVYGQAVKWRQHVLHFTGRDLLPVYLEQLFKYCRSGGSFVSTATPDDLKVFTGACVEYKNELKHAATTIQLAFRVPKSTATSKVVLWKRLYQEKIKSVDEEDKIKSESKPTIVVTKHRSYKPSINSKKNRAARQTTLSGMRKSKKAADLARRRGLVAASLPIIQAPVRALILYAPTAPIKKKKKDSSITSSRVSQLTKFEHLLQEYMPIQFTSIFSKCTLTSITEVDEPIEFMSILKTLKCKILPIMEVEEPVDFASILKTPKYRLNSIMEEDDQGEIKVEATTTTVRSDDTSETDEPRQLEQEAEAEDDNVFGQANEPLLDSDHIPEAALEPIQSPKKLQRRRCKAVESSLDGRYWSVSSRRRRKSSRVRRQPDFFTPS